MFSTRFTKGREQKVFCSLTAHISWWSCRHGETRAAGLACSGRDKVCRELFLFLLVCFASLEASEADRKRQCDNSRNQSRAPLRIIRPTKQIQTALRADVAKASSLLKYLRITA